MLNCSIVGITWWVSLVSILWLMCSLLLIGIILIQKGKGGGLGGAFGGAGGGGGLLGTKTGDFLTWVTIALVFMFFFLAILLVKFGKSTTSDDLKADPVAPITATEGVGAGDATTDGDDNADTENTDVQPE